MSHMAARAMIFRSSQVVHSLESCRTIAAHLIKQGLPVLQFQIVWIAIDEGSDQDGCYFEVFGLYRFIK